MGLEIDLSGRVALVTGGSRGLGRADALTLARAGADVVIADIQIESDSGAEAERYGPMAQAARAQGLVYSEATAREIGELGRRSVAIKCDVTARDEVEDTVRRVVGDFGSVDILVNNAGTLDHLAQLPDQVPALWERDLRVNLTGSFNCAQAVWPHMKERGWGRIVNMASVAGTLGGFGQASYSTTKAGILGLTRTLAMDGGRHGITCNAIVPGVIRTEAFRMAGCDVTVVPASTPAQAVLERKPDGVFLSNGPGDPEGVPYLIASVATLLSRVPVFGICLGHQIMGLAGGGSTYKLKFGHHGANHPVRDLATRKVAITAQNHGFAVEPASAARHGWEPTHVNLNDGTCEGLRHREWPAFSVQYHPEASPGPHDANDLFHRFTELMTRKGG